MQANLSLFINVLLLIGVIFTIMRIMKARRQKFNTVDYQPSVAPSMGAPGHDDIIAVRKINRQEDEQVVSEPIIAPVSKRQVATPSPRLPIIHAEMDSILEEKPTNDCEKASSLMMFLLAKENRLLAGYELLQTVLAAGLRFGEGQLFHRHQSSNGQGPVLCSLAAATPTGVFDLQNIGAFNVHGLCLFMQASGNPTIDSDRFSIMLDTAKQLSDGLDCHLLDDSRKTLDDASIRRYHRLLNLKAIL